MPMSNAPEPASPKTSTAIAMTENKPPTEAQASAASNADQPGRPYYEQLRTTLRGTLDKKRKLDEQLAALEDQIFKLEGAYLEETSNSGNIVRGFDGWVKGVSVGGRAGDDRRRGRVRDEDRVFSHSSVGWMKVRMLQYLKESLLDKHTNSTIQAQEGPDSNTPSHAATPTGSVPASLSRAESTSGATGKTGNKKKRATDKDDDDEKAPKRGKITYSRD
jgi:chromatin modification-related protein EAF6